MTERRRFDGGQRAAARSHGGAASRALARSCDGAASRDVLLAGERWADTWRAELLGLDDAERARWEALLRCASDATVPRATPEWREAGVAAVRAVGIDDVRAAVSTAFGRLNGGGALSLDDHADHSVVADGNANVLRGLVWLLMLEPWPALPQLLGTLCETCMAKVPGAGPRAQKVANACIASLGALAASTDAGLRAGAVSHLARARAVISDRATRVAISTAIASAAAALGLAADELEELAVPDLGFRDGRLTLELGGARVQLVVEGLAVVAHWTDRHGRALRGAPDRLRTEHAEELAGVKQIAKGAESILAEACARIVASVRLDRSWPLAIWREHYLEHGLVGTIVRRMLWEVDGSVFLIREDGPTDVEGRPFPLTPAAVVAPWRSGGAPTRAFPKRDGRELEAASDFDRVPLVVSTSVVQPLGKLPQEE